MCEQLRFPFFHRPIEPCFQIAARIGAGVFLDEEAGRGMPDEKCALTVSESGGLYRGFRLRSKLMQSLIAGGDGQNLDHSMAVALGGGLMVTDAASPSNPRRFRHYPK